LDLPCLLALQTVVQTAAALEPSQYKSRAEIDGVLAKGIANPGERSFVMQVGPFTAG
jgi:hypothetical protein